MQQLREHGVAAAFAGVFCLKPDFLGLNVNLALGVALESQGFDVGILNVFFALDLLELGVKAHGHLWKAFF